MVRLLFYVFAILSIAFVFIGSFFWPNIHILLFFIIPIILLGIYDIRSKHNVLRNYPVIGHLRYMFEFIRPEIQQYFIATNLSGRPYNRETRELIYQRAAGLNDTLPFGTQHDIDELGYIFIEHSLKPAVYSRDTSRIEIGGKDCKRKYNASRLNISGMSYGALSPTAIEAMNHGAKLRNFAQNTGEGGLTKHHLKYGGDIIWQIGTGYFGCRNPDGSFSEEKFKTKAHLDEVKMIEIKLSQGAKPSHGGLLPAAKVNEVIAEIRGIPVGEDCLSPATHSTFNTPLGLLKFVQRCRDLSGGKPVGFKLCIGKRSEFLAICKAMLETGITPDFITVDGAEGGTGAAPLEFSNHIGTPINEAILYVHNALIGCNLRKEITLIASGKISKSFDMVTKIALGADCCHVARAMMFAVGCIQALRCHKNTCPTGVATLNKHRYKAIDPIDKGQAVANYHRLTIRNFLEILSAVGIADPADISPEHIKYKQSPEIVKTFADLYPQLEPGALLGRNIPIDFKDDWEKADANHF